MVLLSCAILQVACIGHNHTPDSVLKQNFFAHEAEFQLLRDEVIEDAKMLGKGFRIKLVSPNDLAERTPRGLSSKRWETISVSFVILGLRKAEETAMRPDSR